MNYNHQTKKPGRRKVHWGKHAGSYFEEVPTAYLEWFVKNAYSQMVDRKRWAEEELNRRQSTKD